MLCDPNRSKRRRRQPGLEPCLIFPSAPVDVVEDDEEDEEGLPKITFEDSDPDDDDIPAGSTTPSRKRSTPTSVVRACENDLSPRSMGAPKRNHANNRVIAFLSAIMNDDLDRLIPILDREEHEQLEHDSELFVDTGGGWTDSNGSFRSNRRRWKRSLPSILTSDVFMEYLLYSTDEEEDVPPEPTSSEYQWLHPFLVACRCCSANVLYHLLARYFKRGDLNAIQNQYGQNGLIVLLSQPVDVQGRTTALYELRRGQFLDDLILDENESSLLLMENHKALQGMRARALNHSLSVKKMITKLLLDWGLDPYARDGYNRDTFYYLNHFGYFEILEFVSSYGKPGGAERPRALPTLSWEGTNKKTGEITEADMQEAIEADLGVESSSNPTIPISMVEQEEVSEVLQCHTPEPTTRKPHLKSTPGILSTAAPDDTVCLPGDLSCSSLLPTACCLEDIKDASCLFGGHQKRKRASLRSTGPSMREHFSRVVE